MAAGRGVSGAVRTALSTSRAVVPRDRRGTDPRVAVWWARRCGPGSARGGESARWVRWGWVLGWAGEPGARVAGLLVFDGRDLARGRRDGRFCTRTEIRSVDVRRCGRCRRGLDREDDDRAPVVDRDRHPARGVLEDQQLAGATSAKVAAPRAAVHRPTFSSGPSPDSTPPPAASCTLPKRSTVSTSASIQPSPTVTTGRAGGPGSRTRDTGPASPAAPGGDAGRGRREDVPAVEGAGHVTEEPVLVGQLDRRVDAAERLGGPDQQAVVRADQHAVRGCRSRCPRRDVPTPGSTTAKCTECGRCGAVCASTAAPRATSAGGTWWVTSMTRTSGAIRAIAP